MKQDQSAASTERELDLTKEERIKATMESGNITFPGVKFDKDGNIKRRLNIEVEPFNAEIIFSNEAFLKYIVIQLRKYLEERLIHIDLGFTCFGNDNLEDQWIVTEQFCEEMGIDFSFISQLNDYLDHPACEGDFLNDFSAEEVVETVQQFAQESDQSNNENSRSVNPPPESIPAEKQKAKGCDDSLERAS